MTEPDWQAVKDRHPIGSEVSAVVADVFPANRVDRGTTHRGRHTTRRLSCARTDQPVA
jgi:hypothetical protein